jgi:Tol biopolymer transport system component
MRRGGLFVAAAAVAMITVVAAQQGTDTALRAAIEQQTVKGDLKGAIAAYQKIADSSAQTRAVRAEALMRMGACYQTLGDAQAKQAFERVIRDFADQPPLVARARTALRDLGAAHSTGELTMRQLGVLPEFANTVSDSGLLAAGTDWANTGNIIVWDVATGNSRPVTGQRVAKPAQYNELGEEPIFSPDATQVAYTWCAAVTPAAPGSRFRCIGELRISRIREGETDTPRTLYRQSTWTEPLAWSPDGSKIAALADQRLGSSDLLDLLLVSTSGGSTTTLDTWPHPGNAWRAAFSRDGKYLALDKTSPTRGDSDVVVYDVSNSKRIDIAVTSSDERLVGWTADGGSILFTSDGNRTNDLYQVQFAGGAVRGSARVVRSDLGNADPLMVSRGGTIYYAKSSSSQQVLHVGAIDFNTGTVTLSQSESGAFGPIWTRGGTALAYLSRQHAPRGGFHTTVKLQSNGTTQEISSGAIWPISLLRTFDPNILLVEATSAPNRLPLLLYQLDLGSGVASLIGPGRAVQVSADGRHAYYFRGDAPTHELVGRDLATGAEQTLLTYQHPDARIVESAYVSDDGARLYYRVPDPDAARPYPSSRILVRDIKSSREQELLSGRLGPFKPSPDGRYLATSQIDGNGKTVRLLSLQGSEPVRDLLHVDGSVGFSWGPDSRFMLVDGQQNGKNTSWWVPLGGAVPKQLSQYVPSPAINSDGKRIAFSVSDNMPTRVEIWEMNPFAKDR